MAPVGLSRKQSDRGPKSKASTIATYRSALGSEIILLES
jgi:hypothetical protein